MQTLKAQLSQLLLGTGRKARLRTAHTLLGFGIYLMFVGVQLAAVSFGLLQWDSDLPLLVFTLISGGGFYLLVRTGLSERLSSDPALPMPQMVAAVFCVAWAYALAGAAGGAVIGIMVVVILFSVFSLDVRQTFVASGLALFALSAVVVYRACMAVPGFNMRLEVIQLILCAIMMGAVSALATRWHALRQRLTRQRAELADALARIEALATQDPLTGLLNRRAMLDAIQREARIAERGGPTPLSLALVDLDHFKRINDGHGHRVGDLVLQAFAKLATAELRGADLLARWGGEEFVLLLPATDSEAAAACLQRIRQRLLQWRPDGAGGDLVVTFSAGLACCAGVDDIDAAIERADRAMYRAKMAGRDRSEFEGGVDGPRPLAAAVAAAPPELSAARLSAKAPTP